MNNTKSPLTTPLIYKLYLLGLSLYLLRFLFRLGLGALLKFYPETNPFMALLLGLDFWALSFFVIFSSAFFLLNLFVSGLGTAYLFKQERSRLAALAIILSYFTLIL